MCTGVVLEKLKCGLWGEIYAPQWTQTAVRGFTCQVLSSASATQPPCMGATCYTDFQFTVIWDLHVVWRGVTCTQAGLTFPPLRIRVDPRWQKVLRGSKGHILPNWVLIGAAVTRTPPKCSPRLVGFCFGVFLVWSMYTPCIASLWSVTNPHVTKHGIFSPYLSPHPLHLNQALLALLFTAPSGFKRCTTTSMPAW